MFPNADKPQLNKEHRVSQRAHREHRGKIKTLCVFVPPPCSLCEYFFLLVVKESTVKYLKRYADAGENG